MGGGGSWVHEFGGNMTASEAGKLEGTGLLFSECFLWSLFTLMNTSNLWLVVEGFLGCGNEWQVFIFYFG